MQDVLQPDPPEGRAVGWIAHPRSGVAHWRKTATLEDPRYVHLACRDMDGRGWKFYTNERFCKNCQRIINKRGR